MGSLGALGWCIRYKKKPAKSWQLTKMSPPRSSASPFSDSSGEAAKNATAGQTASAAGETPNPPPHSDPSLTGELVSEVHQVHGKGKFFSIEPTDYKNNIPAIKSLLNEKNSLQKKVDEAIDPGAVRVATVFGAIINVLAVALAGIGTNLLTSDHPPAWAGWILFIGLMFSLVATIGPIIVAFKGAGIKRGDRA